MAEASARALAQNASASKEAEGLRLRREAAALAVISRPNYRRWYGACRQIAKGRTAASGSFLASFGPARFRAGFQLYPNGLSGGWDLPRRSELVAYLDEVATGKYSRSYRRIHIAEMRNWRQREGA